MNHGIFSISAQLWRSVSRNHLETTRNKSISCASTVWKEEFNFGITIKEKWPQCILERYWNRLTPQSRHFWQKRTSYRAWLRCKVQLKVLRETAGKCHDDQQKGQNQFGCGRTLWAMKTTYECVLMYGAHNREIKCSHYKHKFGTSKFLIRVASLKRPQWPTTYWYVGLNGWSWLRCRAPGILLEVVTTTKIKGCGRRNVQSSLAPMSWHSIRFEFQKQFSEMSSMHQTDMEDWLYKASWMRQISCKLTCPLACLIALQSTA